MNIKKIYVGGTGYDIEDTGARTSIDSLDTSLAHIQSLAGSPNGLATLDNNTKIPSTQLPMPAINRYIASNTKDSVIVTTNSKDLIVTSYDSTELHVGSGLTLTFLTDITGLGGSETITISYNNGISYPIKVAKDGNIINFNPFEITTNNWKFLQTGTSFEVRYIESGNEIYWLIVGNPVVISSATDGYEIYANGYKKVNTVTVDNMNVVTSNAVATALSYVTTEHFTGEYWVSGQPIYRKTIDCGYLPNATDKTIAHLISNFDQAIKVFGMATSSLGNNYPVPYTTLNTDLNIQVFVDKTNIELTTGIDRSAFYCYITIEYTKTSQ